MEVQFKALPFNSPSLFPENIFDRIPLNRPVRLVNQVVDQLDIEHLIGQYKGGAFTIEWGKTIKQALLKRLKRHSLS